MKNLKITLALISAAALTAVTAVSCGKTEEPLSAASNMGSSNSNEGKLDDKNAQINNTDAKNAETADEVKTIKIGTGNNYNPACYLDDSGELDGYDPAVLKAVDELLPQYKFTYETFDFQNVVLALESGKIDLAAHQYEWNQQREDNYLFSDEGYTVYDMYVWQTGDDDTVYKSIDDLAGKTVHASAGDNLSFFLENWNKENPDKKINLDYTVPATTEETISYYLSGKWSVFVVPKKDIELYNEAYAGCDFKLAFDEPLYSSNTYFLYRKNDPEETALKEAVDGAIAELKKSGKLGEISEKYWGGDYTVSNAAYDFHKE